MKKRVFAIFACMLLVLSAGCGKKDPAPETPDAPTTGMPAPMEAPTQEEILDMYTYAEEIYSDISMADFTVDPERSIIKEDYTYHRITDERFESYDDFLKYLNLYFTKDFVQNELMDNTLFTEGKDGYLYVLDAGRGTDIFYAGHEVGEPVISENEITFDVTAYYTVDEPYERDPFDATFLPDGEFETEVYSFRLVPEEGLWKFDDFHLFY